MSETRTIKQVDVADHYGISDRTVRRWERQGLISGTRIGGLKLYPVADVERLVGIRIAEREANRGDTFQD